MEVKTFKSDLLLLIAASIWGFAFVAQRMGMDYVGPFTFTGVRFALGGLSLLPFVFSGIRKRKNSKVQHTAPELKEIIAGGALSGSVLFVAANLQQVGMVYTTAGKSGFITGLYVVIVPIIGLFRHQKAGLGTWAGAFMGVAGLYLLSVNENMTINFGDFLEFIGAFCFALHVVIIGELSKKIDTARLAFVQCLLCSLLSLAVALFLENMTIHGIWMAIVPIVYGGVFSVGIAYSLQIYGQKNSHPAHAAILMSLESVMAAFGGWLILNEILSSRALTGCILMMTGMLVSQLYSYVIPRRAGRRQQHV